MQVRGYEQDRFNHGADFQPLAQFNLAFSCLSGSTSQIVDQRGRASPADVTVGRGSSLGRILQDWGPIAAL